MTTQEKDLQQERKRLQDTGRRLERLRGKVRARERTPLMTDLQAFQEELRKKFRALEGMVRNPFAEEEDCPMSCDGASEA